MELGIILNTILDSIKHANESTITTKLAFFSSLKKNLDIQIKLYVDIF